MCLSVTRHFTSRVLVRLTKETTYWTGNEGQISNGFPWKRSVAKIERFNHCKAKAILSLRKNAHALIFWTGFTSTGPLALCILKSQRRDYRMLLASPCQTLRELLDTKSPAHQLVVPRVRNSPRVYTSVWWSSYSCPIQNVCVLKPRKCVYSSLNFYTCPFSYIIIVTSENQVKKPLASLDRMPPRLHATKASEVY